MGMSDPLNSPIEAYVEDGWMKARGTSLGADNGIGLSMALAVLESNDIVHGPLEVMTTTNEEDGMSGASQLSKDFLVGRKVIDLDSEDYDTITTGAAGACLQFHRIPMKRQPAPSGKHRWYRIRFEGGLGGHSGVDINKGRCSAVVAMWAILAAIYNEYDFDVASINLGEANASIASSADIILCVPSGEASEFVKSQQDMMNEWLREEYPDDPKMTCSIEKCEQQDTVISKDAFEALMTCLGGPAVAIPAAHLRHLPRRAGLAPPHGGHALRARSRILRTALSRHPNGQHRPPHRRAAFHQRTRRTLHHQGHLVRTHRTAETTGVI